jgi:hypothetical protein
VALVVGGHEFFKRGLSAALQRRAPERRLND